MGRLAHDLCVTWCVGSSGFRWRKLIVFMNSLKWMGCFAPDISVPENHKIWAPERINVLLTNLHSCNQNSSETNINTAAANFSFDVSCRRNPKTARWHTRTRSNALPHNVHDHIHMHVTCVLVKIDEARADCGANNIIKTNIDSRSSVIWEIFDQKHELFDVVSETKRERDSNVVQTRSE